VPSLFRRFKGETKVRRIEVGALASRVDEAEAITIIDVRGPDEFQ